MIDIATVSCVYDNLEPVLQKAVGQPENVCEYQALADGRRSKCAKLNRSPEAALYAPNHSLADTHLT